MEANDPALASRCACGCSRPTPRLGATKHSPLLLVVALALLPKCPLCVMAWFGVFCSVEARSWLIDLWGTPLAVALLSVPMGALVLRALRGRSWSPLVVGLLGSGALLAGKCYMDTLPLVCAGLGLMIVASQLAFGGFEQDRMRRE